MMGPSGMLPPEAVSSEFSPAPGTMPPQPTLGQVSDTMNSPSEVDQMFQQALRLTQRAYAGALRPPMPEPKRGLGWWLGNAATFGGMGMAEQAYAQGYNRQVRRDNQTVATKAAADAVDLTQRQMGLKGAGLQQQLAIARLDATIANLQLSKNRFDLEKLKTQYGFAKGMTTPFPNEEQTIAGGQLGQVPVPSKFPGRAEWKPAEVQPGAQNYNPPAATSPLGQALGGEKTAQSQPRTFQELREQKKAVAVAQQTEIATAKQKLEQRRTVGPALAIAKQLQDAVEKAYSPEQGPLAAQTIGRAQRTWGALTGDPANVRLATIGGKLPQIIVGLGQEKRISDQDAKLMFDAMPKSSDTLEAARVKIGDLVTTLRNRLENPPSPEEVQGTAPGLPDLGLPPGFKVLRRVR